ncbi:hypothetical protein CPB86DRAFT_719073 [Serendipita vermifera]|nr:hypothetical protein CPB86DRAFT_719073 [Serendipita vermifera]
MSLDPRPIPNNARHWHRHNVNCVKISLDGTLIASAGNDGRVLVSDIASGNLLHEIVYKMAVRINCVVWLRTHRYRRLAAGCSDGSIFTYSLGPKWRCRMKLYRKFSEEVEMLEYDAMSERALVAFRDALSICKFQSTEQHGIPEPNILTLDSEVGGIGFVASGARCLATLPQENSM